MVPYRNPQPTGPPWRVLLFAEPLLGSPGAAAGVWALPPLRWHQNRLFLINLQMLFRVHRSSGKRGQNGCGEAVLARPPGCGEPLALPLLYLRQHKAGAFPKQRLTL